jgi:hypothetical protein
VHYGPLFYPLEILGCYYEQIIDEDTLYVNRLKWDKIVKDIEGVNNELQHVENH